MHETNAKDAMSKPLIMIRTDHSMKDALELMRKHKIRRLVVEENGVLAGLVTERRILNLISRY